MTFLDTALAARAKQPNMFTNPQVNDMSTVARFIITMIAITLIIGVGYGEGVLTGIYTAVPIFVPATYLSHIIFYEYDTQKDYTQLFQVPHGRCAHGQPAAFAAAVWLSAIFAAWLINNGLSAFDVVSISLVTLAGYFLDKRKNHTAYKALACKLATLFGISHG